MKLKMFNSYLLQATQESSDHHLKQRFSNRNRVLHSQDPHILIRSIKQLTLKLSKNISLLLHFKNSLNFQTRNFLLAKIRLLKIAVAGEEYHLQKFELEF